jgi:hypothetical protein
MRQTLLTGIAALIIGIALILLPLLLGRWDFNKYFVVAGIISSCFGVCCLLLGAMEALRGGRR